MTPYLVLLVAAAAVAGCISPEDQEVDEDAALRDLLLGATPHGDDHDHHSLVGHNASMNMKTLAWSPGHDMPTTYGEIDAQSGIIATAILHQVGDRGPGFFLVDASDPNDLTPLSVYTDLAPSVYLADLKLSPDGNWLFLAVQNFGQIEDHQGLPEVPDLPVDTPRWPNTIVDSGVYIFDISDPTDPMLAGFHTEQYRGVHMMYVHEIGGNLYAFLQSQRSPSGMCFPEELMCPNDTPLFEGGNRVTIAEFTTAGGKAALERVAEYQGFESHYIHDMTVYDDAEAGKTLMYVAHWNHGVTVVDVSDAANGNVEEIGAWSPQEFLESSLYGNVHTVMADWVGDRRIVIGSPELGYAEQVPPIYILDATDFSNITELARWTIPNEGLNYTAEAGETPLYRWSPHNFQFMDGMVFLAHFHGGVWVLDLNEDPANPEVVGYSIIEPQGYGGGALGGALGDSPSVWDVVVHGGKVWASDINSGLYSLKLVTEDDMAMTEEAVMDAS